MSVSLNETQRFMFSKPRRLKKAFKKWLYPGRITRGERRRIIRAFNHVRAREGWGPVRRLPDGRVSLLELP